MGLFISEEFNEIDGIQAATPKGGFYFYADFNRLARELRSKSIFTSNDLGRSLIGCPHHIATVTGDALMLRPDDYGARIAFVDYDGKKAFEDYKEKPPKSKVEEVEFVKNNAPQMIRGVEALKRYVEYLRQ
ncbi:MAG: hypothetical protein J7K32_00090 [Deltaproteobacteria bacterium]|nr:hypothetical protein [Deltaproteobacteria bacterium]